MPDGIKADQRTMQEWTRGSYAQEDNLARTTDSTLDCTLQRGTLDPHSPVAAHRFRGINM